MDKPTDRDFASGFQASFGNGEALAAAISIQRELSVAVLRWQVEGLCFLRRRLEQDMKLAETLANPEAAKDAFELLTTFWQAAGVDYVREASRFATIGARLSTDTARDLRTGAEKMAEDLVAQRAA
jgi:hypothetical protein